MIVTVKLKKASWRILSQQINIIFCCLRGVIYYKKMWSDLGNLNNSKNNVLRFTNSCYHDVAIISWPMLFGTNNNPTHWKKLFSIDEIKKALRTIGLSDQNIFRNTMLTQCKIDKGEYKQFHKDCLDYRNKYLAHRVHDPEKISDNDLYVPYLDIPYKTAGFLYNIIARIIQNIDDNQNGNSYQFSFYNEEQLKETLYNEADNLVKMLLSY